MNLPAQSLGKLILLIFCWLFLFEKRSYFHVLHNFRNCILENVVLGNCRAVELMGEKDEVILSNFILEQRNHPTDHVTLKLRTVPLILNQYKL